MSAVLRWLPRGIRLSDEAFRSRHKLLVGLLLLHVPILLLIGLAGRFTPLHMAVDVAPVAGLAYLGVKVRNLAMRSILVSLGLLYVSADLSHLVHNTAMHFHFFVVLGFIALYQDWRPYLLSIGFVLIHHMGLGMIFPKEVFGDPQAIAHPIRWALIHAAFVAAASVAQVAMWKFVEDAQTEAADIHRRASVVAAEQLSAQLASERARRENAEAAAAQVAAHRDLQQRLALQASVLNEGSQTVNANIQALASVAEELHASIREIAMNVTEAGRVAGIAVTLAGTTQTEMASLDERSVEIGRILTLIGSIAQQTHLLALNAAIEAARAGDAGKGFAVVATEVKELARGSAAAADDIARMVGAMQSGTRIAVDAIAEIGAIIERISDFQVVIAAAIEEQTATTGEISRNVGEAALASAEMAHSIVELADSSQQLT